MIGTQRVHPPTRRLSGVLDPLFLLTTLFTPPQLKYLTCTGVFCNIHTRQFAIESGRS